MRTLCRSHIIQIPVEPQVAPVRGQISSARLVGGGLTSFLERLCLWTTLFFPAVCLDCGRYSQRLLCFPYPVVCFPLLPSSDLHFWCPVHRRDHPNNMQPLSQYLPRLSSLDRRPRPGRSRYNRYQSRYSVTAVAVEQVQFDVGLDQVALVLKRRPPVRRRRAMHTANT